jgi:hypothetical protein
MVVFHIRDVEFVRVPLDGVGYVESARRGLGPDPGSFLGRVRVSGNIFVDLISTEVF